VTSAPKSQHRRYCIDKYEYTRHPHRDGNGRRVMVNLPKAQSNSAPTQSNGYAPSPSDDGVRGAEPKATTPMGDHPRSCPTLPRRPGSTLFPIHRGILKATGHHRPELAAPTNGVAPGRQAFVRERYGVCDMPGNATLAASETLLDRSTFDNATGRSVARRSAQPSAPEDLNPQRGIRVLIIEVRCCAKADANPPTANHRSRSSATKRGARVQVHHAQVSPPPFGLAFRMETAKAPRRKGREIPKPFWRSWRLG